MGIYQSRHHTIGHINADIITDIIYRLANEKMMRVKKLSCLETVVLSVSQYVEHHRYLCLVGMQTDVQSVVKEF